MTVREILEQIVAARQRRADRANKVPDAYVSPDEKDLLLIDLLAAKLELARELAKC